MKELLVLLVEAFIFSTLTVTLAELLWGWFVKTPYKNKVKKYEKKSGYAIWCIFVILKYNVFWFDKGDHNHRHIPAQYPYVVEKGKSETHLMDKSNNDVLSCNISQFAIEAGRFFYTCTGNENDIKVFDFESKTIRTANSGPVLRNFNHQFYWYHYFRIDVAGIIIFAGIQLCIMIILQKSRSKKLTGFLLNNTPYRS